MAKVKKCLGNFRIPECLFEECRYECLKKFNKGRNIKIRLEGGNAVEKEKVKTVKKVVDFSRYDKETVKQLRVLLSGTAIEHKKNSKGIRWIYKNLVIARIKRAKNGNAELIVSKGFLGKEALFRGKKQWLKIVNVKSRTQELRQQVVSYINSHK